MTTDTLVYINYSFKRVVVILRFEAFLNMTSATLLYFIALLSFFVGNNSV